MDSTFFPRVGCHSVSWLFVHIVWATRGRDPWLDLTRDAPLERFFKNKARELDAAVIGCGVASDHVHLLVQLQPELAIATLVGRLKGSSSKALGTSLQWQVGYWVESVNASQLQRALTYVEGQRARHERGLLSEPWEADLALRRPA